MKRWFNLVLILIFPINILMSQEDELGQKIKAQLSSDDKNNIEKAEKRIESANVELQKVEELETSNKKKALKLKIKVSNELAKANKIIYRIYKKDLERFFNNIDPVKKKKAELKIDKAELYMKEAKKKRSASLRLNVLDNVNELLDKANKYEKKAITYLIEVYAMFIGTSSVIGTDKRLGNEIAVTTSHVEEEKVIELEPDDEAISKKSEEDANEKEVVVEKKRFEPIKIIGSNGIFFLIQVAASKSPISQESLRRSYTRDVLGEKFGEWYKYFINIKFPSFEQAEAYRANLNAKGSFVVAFKNGKKVSVAEAQRNEELEKAVGVKKVNKGVNRTVAKETKIVYYLEVGISIKRLPASEVRRFKSGGRTIVAIDRNGWYSYVVGEFKSEPEALHFKRIRGLSDAVVLKVKNGKVIED